MRTILLLHGQKGIWRPLDNEVASGQDITNKAHDTHPPHCLSREVMVQKPWM
jgi:hypothetical protein